MKKLICLVLMAVLLACAVTGHAADAANTGTDTGIDIVVLIDRSGSMLSTDPNNLALMATSALAGISNTGAAGGGVSIAIVPFDYNVTSGGFHNVSDPVELNALQNELNQVAAITEKGADTNTGKALEEACDIIQKQRQAHPNHLFAVVLLSDGKVRVGDSQAWKSDPNRTDDATDTERSRQQGSAAAQRLAADGIRLYTIGLRVEGYRGSVDLGTDLGDWAALTGGQFYLISNADQINNTMLSLYQEINGQAEMLLETLSNDHPAEFDVDYGVLQVSVQITPYIRDHGALRITRREIGSQSDTPLTTSEYSVEDSLPQLNAKGVLQDSQYSIIKLKTPPAGHYTISINDSERHTYRLTIFTIRDLQMELEPIAPVENGSPAEFALKLIKDGSDYQDAGLGPEAIVYDENHTEIARRPLTWDPARARYVGIYQSARSGSFTVQAHLLSQYNVENYSPEVPMVVQRTAIKPLSGAGLSDVDFKGHALKYYDENGAHDYYTTPKVISFNDIEACFENIEGYPILDVNLVPDPSAAILQVEKDSAARTFSILPLQAGSCELGFALSYDQGVTEAVNCHVEVEDAQAPLELNPNPGWNSAYKIEAFLPAKDEAAILDNVRDGFLDPNAADGDTYVVTLSTDGSGALEARLDGDRLLVRGLRRGSEDIVLTAQGYDGGAPVELQLRIDVVDLKMQYIKLALIALGVLLAAALVIWLISNARKPSYTRSVLNIILESEDETEEGSALLLRYGKKPMKLSTICTQNGIRMGSARGMLDKITIQPRKGGGIQVRCKFRDAALKSFVLQSMDSHVIELDKSGSWTLELEYDEDEDD